MSTAYLLFLVLLGCALCDTVWDEKFPSPTGGLISSGAYGNNKFLLTGSDGLLLQSPDGSTWTQCPSFADGDYLSAQYANGFTLVTDSDYSIFYSPTGDCSDSNWSSLRFNTDYTYSNNILLSPAPVPSNWGYGFISVSNYRAYYSIDGSYQDFTELDIDYDNYQVWSVATDGTQWILKLALITDVTLSPDTLYKIYVVTVDIVSLEISEPIDTSYTSRPDSGFAYTSNQFISAAYEGIIYSSDAGLSWNLKQDVTDVYQFEKLVCSGDRCVAVGPSSTVYDSSDAGTSFNLISLARATYIEPSFPLVSLNEANPDSAIFLIASDFGTIYTSTASGVWDSTGSSSDASTFEECRQFVWYDPFILGCNEHLLLSDDAQDWTSRPYNIGTSLSLLTTSDTSVVGVANKNDVYLTTDNIGLEWEMKVSFRLQEANTFELSNMKYFNDIWIGFGSDRWTIVEGDDQGTSSIVPMMVRSDDGDVWGIYSMNVMMNDLTYSKDNNVYIGAGLNGVYTSPNMYNWTRSTPTNGACSAIASDGHLNYISLCANSARGLLSNILKVTINGGQDWSDLNSPCTSNGANGEWATVACGSIMYNKNLEGFLLYSQNPTGDVYFSENGLSWAPLTVPYSLRIYGMSDHDSLFVTLSHEAVYSGNSDDIEFGVSVPASLYTSATTSEVPALPSIEPGFIISEPNDLVSSSFVASTFELDTSVNPTTLDVSSFRQDQYDAYINNDISSSSGLSGGGIFGIILAIMVAGLVVLVIVALILYAQKQKNNKQRKEEQARILNQENDLL